MRISPRSPTGSCRRPRRCRATAGGGAVPRSPTEPSNGACCASYFRLGGPRPPSDPSARHAAHTVGAEIELDVMERIGGDLGEPHDPLEYALLNAKLHRAEQQGTEAQQEPHDTEMVHVLGITTGECAEQRGLEPQHDGTQRP